MSSKCKPTIEDYRHTLDSYKSHFDAIIKVNGELHQKIARLRVALDEKIRTQALEAAMRIVGADGEFHNVGGITYNPGQKTLLVCESIYQWLTKDAKP